METQIGFICTCAGTGIQARLRTVCRKDYGFNSHQVHLFLKAQTAISYNRNVGSNPTIGVFQFGAMVDANDCKSFF